MNSSEAKAMHGPISTSTAQEAVGGSALEAVGAIAAIVLAVIGLVGVLANQFAAIVAIILGASFLVEGWVMNANHRMRAQAGLSSYNQYGFSAQTLGGLTGIVLGIISLFRPGTELLAAIALLVFGATLMLRTWTNYYSTNEWFATSGWSGLVLVGVGAVVLGILAVCGLNAVILTLVGELGIGAAFLLGGSFGETASTFHASA